MKKILPWIFVAICLVVDFGLLRKLQNVQRIGTKIERQFLHATKENEQLKATIGHFYQKEGSLIPDEKCTTDEGYKVNLHEVIKSAAINKILIFRYASSDCSDCVDVVFGKLAGALNVDKIIVISDFKSVASMKFLKKKYNLENAVLLKSANTNVVETPCVFLSNKDLKINKFLIIHAEDKVLDKYLRIL
jgi:hypothetical protein